MGQDRRWRVVGEGVGTGVNGVVPRFREKAKGGAEVGGGTGGRCRSARKKVAEDGGRGGGEAEVLGDKE